jgi:hypothetical protein
VVRLGVHRPPRMGGSWHQQLCIMPHTGVPGGTVRTCHTGPHARQLLHNTAQHNTARHGTARHGTGPHADGTRCNACAAVPVDQTGCQPASGADHQVGCAPPRVSQSPAACAGSTQDLRRRGRAQSAPAAADLTLPRVLGCPRRFFAGSRPLDGGRLLQMARLEPPLPLGSQGLLAACRARGQGSAQR